MVLGINDVGNWDPFLTHRNGWLYILMGELVRKGIRYIVFHTFDFWDSFIAF